MILTSVTVMASDSSDKFAIFSNYGTCAHIIAPVSDQPLSDGHPQAIASIAGSEDNIYMARRRN